MDFCFIHSADLHLGGRRWLREKPSSQHIADTASRADQLALTALVDLCLQEGAKVLLCSGDLVDGWCRDHTVGMWLVHELLRLREGSCEAVLLLGNHDVRTRVVKPLLLPEHACCLGLGGPETRVFDALGLALHGWSFPEPAQPTDVASLYPAPLAGLLNVGLLHTSAEGRRGHSDYAPCSRRTLRRHGYDYWALGHVHTREVIAEDPWIVFPGNLQGRGARESGAKGATLVRVSSGKIRSVEHRSLDALRFATVVADTSAARNFDDVVCAAKCALLRATAEAEGRPLVVRLVLNGVAGAACTLAVPTWERPATFKAFRHELCSDCLWVDETWVNTGVGSWLLDVAA